MTDGQILAKVLKDAMKGGKCSLGAKESIAAMKGSKALILTRSVPQGLGLKLRDEAKKHKVPIVESGITSAELARMVGRPYKVSAIALRAVSESDLKQLSK